MSVDRPAGAARPVAATAGVEVNRLCRAAAAAAPALGAMGRIDRASLLTALGEAKEADRAGIVTQADREPTSVPFGPATLLSSCPTGRPHRN